MMVALGLAHLIHVRTTMIMAVDIFAPPIVAMAVVVLAEMVPGVVMRGPITIVARGTLISRVRLANAAVTRRPIVTCL